MTKEKVIALVLILISIIIGVVLSFTKADTEELLMDKKDLNIKLERLSFQHLLNTIRKDNAKYYDSTHILFDTTSKKISLLTVDNHTVHPCEGGSVDGCWAKEIEASAGDIIAIQIYYCNDGDIPIKDLEFKIDYKNNSFSRTCTAMVLSGNKVIKRDAVNIFQKNFKKYNLIDDAALWQNGIESGAPKHFDILSMIKNKKGFKIARLEPKEFGVIVFHVRGRKG